MATSKRATSPSKAPKKARSSQPPQIGVPEAGRKPLIVALMTPKGLVTVDKVAATFGMSKGQLADTAGLGREALYKLTRLNAPKTQMRIREMLEIISRVADWAGGKDQAMAWYRAQPIAAFGGRTAEALVKDGQASALRDYLDHIAMGGFA
jgi:Protein of unknown function (DUF2384)